MKPSLRGDGFVVRFARRGQKHKQPVSLHAQTVEQDRSTAPQPISPEEQAMVIDPKLSVQETLSNQAMIDLLWRAAKAGDCGAIRILVMDGVDLDARDEEGRTALNIATQYGQHEVIKTLLAAKEMRSLAVRGVLPDTPFFNKFKRKVEF